MGCKIVERSTLKKAQTNLKKDQRELLKEKTKTLKALEI